MSFWDKVLDLLASSVIVQGILTIGVTGVVCYLAIMQIETPKDLWTLLGLAWGFYFGTKAQMVINARSMKRK